MKHQPVLHHRTCLPVVLLVLVLLMAGCPRTAPVSYYQLSSNVAGKTVIDGAAMDGKVIGIGPIRLPERLDRPQIITGMDANRLQVSDSHRWIEPLPENISRVLRENLSILLQTERFLFYPWSRSATVDYQLIVDVVRFDGEGYKTANLEIIWSLEDGKGTTVLQRQRSRYQAATPTPDHQGLVSALSETLTLFCREIAGELSILASEAAREKPAPISKD
ncbi:MAG: PqiC family protein [Desulfobulbaceae bacterium]|nr:PqiC family protein [Desulfobulbaceae bacterium]